MAVTLEELARRVAILEGKRIPGQAGRHGREATVGMRYLGQASLSSFSTTSTTAVDTGLTVTAQSKGGSLLILFAASIEASDATGANVNFFVQAVVDDVVQSSYHTQNSVTGGTAADNRVGGTHSWVVAANPGNHTVKIQLSMGAGNDSAALSSGVLVIIELGTAA